MQRARLHGCRSDGENVAHKKSERHGAVAPAGHIDKRPLKRSGGLFDARAVPDASAARQDVGKLHHVQPELGICEGRRRLEEYGDARPLASPLRALRRKHAREHRAASRRFRAGGVRQGVRGLGGVCGWMSGVDIRRGAGRLDGGDARGWRGDEDEGWILVAYV